MKKIIYSFLTIVMLLNCMIIPISAKSNVTVELNGKKIEFDQPPIIQNGRTLVPMRAIFEAMGCTVEWDNGLIDVWKDGENIMALFVGDTQMWIPNKTITLDVAPQIINDRTLVPVRAISESMGADVEWDSKAYKVIISYDDVDSSENNVNEEDNYIEDEDIIDSDDIEEIETDEEDSEDIEEITSDGDVIVF